MALALALLSSLLLGSADFVGGAAAQRIRPTVVVVWSNATGLALAFALSLVLLPPAPHLGVDLAWGAAAGLAGSLGAVLLYRALACGVMALVAPTSAAAAAVIPVTVGLATGDRLSPLGALGVAVALFSIVLLTRTRSPRAADGQPVGVALTLAVLAGVAFGVFLVLLSHTSPGSGLWPLVAARVGSLSLLVGLARARGVRLRLTAPAAQLPVLAGVLDMGANVAFLAAVHGGELAVVGLLASLAPVGTVALAGLVLRERIYPTQKLGASLAMGSVLLLGWP